MSKTPALPVLRSVEVVGGHYEFVVLLAEGAEIPAEVDEDGNELAPAQLVPEVTRTWRWHTVPPEGVSADDYVAECVAEIKRLLAEEQAEPEPPTRLARVDHLVGMEL